MAENFEITREGLDAFNRGDARGRMSGAGLEFSYWAVITYRNEKVVRMDWFVDRAKALAAVGLSE